MLILGKLIYSSKSTIFNRHWSKLVIFDWFKTELVSDWSIFKRHFSPKIFRRTQSMLNQKSMIQISSFHQSEILPYQQVNIGPRTGRKFRTKIRQNQMSNKNVKNSRKSMHGIICHVFHIICS